MTYRLLRIIVELMSYIPLPVGRFAGKILGCIFSFLPLKRTRVSLDNIQKSIGDSLGRRGAERLNRKVLLHFGQMLFEVPHVFRMNDKNLKSYVTFVRQEILQEALNRGKGVFILTGHLGNWEIMCAALSIRFGRLSVVMRPMDFRPLDRVINDLRSRFGAEMIPKQKAMRKLLDAVKQKRMIGILLDQNVDWYAGVFVKFLGRWACTNKGLALLALKTGTPVIPTFAVRREDGRYSIVFCDEVRLIRTGDKTRDIEENTALFTKSIEDYIRRYPEQWFWFHMRWKTRFYHPLPPSGELT